MPGKLVTPQALGLLPDFPAGWAYPASIKGVPHVVTETRPAIVLARLPGATGTANAQSPIPGDVIGMRSHCRGWGGPPALQHLEGRLAEDPYKWRRDSLFGN